MSRRAAWAIVAYALLAVIVVPVFPHFSSPNEFARWATAVALVEGHTFEVSRLAPLLGRDFEDLSVVNGRFYSNKAPGGALFGLPGYVAGRLLVGGPSPSSMRWTMNAMRLFASTMPTIALAIGFSIAVTRLGAKDVDGALIALLFGTPLFAYGMLNFAHALTAAALFGAWLLLFLRPSPRGDFAAGALIGLAVLSEYPAAIAGAVLVAFAIRERNVLRVIAGGVPFAIALALYNRAIFGSFFTLSSGFERDAQFRDLAAHGLFGVGLPDPMVMVRLLFDSSKGLLVFSPVLLLAIVAAPAARAAMTTRQFWSLVAVPAAIFLTYAGYPNWHGGWTVGVRYLVPAMPFVCVLLGFVRSGLRPVATFALGASVASVAITTLVFPFVPRNVPAPWGTFAIPLLRHELVAPNLLHLVARPLAIVIPFAIVIAAFLLVERPAFVIAGAAFAIVTGMLMPQEPVVIIERSFIEEVNFERAGALERSAPAGMTVSPKLLRRAEGEKSQPPTSWPF